MNPVLHIVRKDLLRLRWQLAVWLLVVGLKLGIGFSLVLGGGFGGFSTDRLQALTLGLNAL